MNIGDVVVYRKQGVPPVGVGQVVGFTPQRVRVASRYGQGFITVTRKAKNLKVEHKYRGMA